MAKKQNKKKVTDEERDEQNKKRFTDQRGIEASDLPDGGRGPVETIPQWEARRNLPHQHGGRAGDEGGTRGDRDLGDADRHGNRGRN